MTPRDVLTAAYAKSKKNQPGVIAAESTELLEVVKRALRGLFAFGARVNPQFFGSEEVVNYVAPGWARPVAAESIYRLEFATPGPNEGKEIVVVGFDDRLAEAGQPAVYRMGQVFRPAGNASDPADTDSIRFFFSKRPDDPANLDADIDPMFPVQYAELLNLETAIYLVVKDGPAARSDEYTALLKERERWVNLFVAFLEHETTIERRRWGHIRAFNTSSLVPLMGLLAPGEAAG